MCTMAGQTKREPETMSSGSSRPFGHEKYPPIDVLHPSGEPLVWSVDALAPWKEKRFTC